MKDRLVQARILLSRSSMDTELVSGELFTAKIEGQDLVLFLHRTPGGVGATHFRSGLLLGKLPDEGFAAGKSVKTLVEELITSKCEEFGVERVVREIGATQTLNAHEGL